MWQPLLGGPAAFGLDHAPVAGSGWDVALPHSGNATNCTFLCPTLTRDPGAWPLWILVSFYLIISVMSVTLLCKKKRLSSFRNLFLYLQIVLCVLRIVTFSVQFPGETKDTILLLLVLSTLPVYIQFVTFSLLITFLMKCLLSIKEKPHLINRFLYPCYTLLLLLLALACYFFAYFGSRPVTQQTSNATDGGSGYDQGAAMYGSITFGVLTLLVGITGLFTRRTLDVYVPKGSKRRNQVDVFSSISVMYFSVFLGRAIWSTTYIFKTNSIQGLMNKWIEEGTPEAQRHYYIALMCFYLLFEIIPTGALLLCFWVWLRPGNRRSSAGVMPRSGEQKPLINEP